MPNSKVIQYADWIIRWRWFVILLTIVSVVGLGYGFSKAYFKSDYRVFFSEDNPQLLAFEEMQRTYNKSDNVLMVVTAKDGNVFSKDTLLSIHKLTDEAWATPYVLRVDSLTNFQHTWAVGEDDLIVKDLVCYPDAIRVGAFESECSRFTIDDTLLATYTEKDFIEIGEIAVSDPVLINRLISKDKRVTAINVTVQLPDNPTGEVLEVANYARELAKSVMAENPNLEVRLTGVIMMNVSFPEATVKDNMTLMPIMFLVVIAMLWFMVRTMSGTVTTVFLIIFSIAGALGAFIWMGGFLTGPVMSAPIIILTMAVADAVHILVTFLQQMRLGRDKNAAMKESLRINMQPVFLTSLTTAIGFLSMNFSDVPPLRDLGNIVAIGVILAFIYSVTFLPALMTLLPVKPSQVEPKAYRWMDGLSDWVILKRRSLLLAMTLLTFGVTAFITKNELNDEFVKYFDTTVPFRADTDYTEKHLTGLYNVFISVKSNQAQGINNPDYLKKIERFVEFAKSQPEVIHVDSLTDVLKRLNKNMHADEKQWYRLPEQRDATAQYLLMYENSLPQGLEISNQIDIIDRSSIRLGVTVKSLSSNEMIVIENRFSDWFETNAPDITIIQASPNLMFAHIGSRNIKSSLIGTLIALVLISGVLIFALKSFKMGLISLIPNLVPAGLAFGLWGMFVGQVGMSLAIVAGMTLGIVVDDTVHFLSKYLRARREKNMNSEDAVRYAFQTVGMALTVTTIVLVAGFYIMTFSSFTMNSDMGMLTALTIAIALIVDFLMLPPLLMKLEEKSNA